MKYTTMLSYEARDKLVSEIPRLQPRLYLLDMDPLAEKMILGPFDNVAEAHDNRDYIWAFGETYGRYLWLLNEKILSTLKMAPDKIQYVQLHIDTVPLEVTGVKIKLEGQKTWLPVPKRRVKQ